MTFSPAHTHHTASRVTTDQVETHHEEQQALSTHSSRAFARSEHGKIARFFPTVEQQHMAQQRKEREARARAHRSMGPRSWLPAPPTPPCLYNERNSSPAKKLSRKWLSLRLELTANGRKAAAKNEFKPKKAMATVVVGCKIDQHSINCSIPVGI
jgi:hypothetical protein